ncbi:MAG: FAD-dependent oxidoreductase [Candidatus Gastranaerophilales bacterium]|nr:FAD-dependent oxidoreductase [Candidatus Gastranaerophilales bacterium]
MYDLIVAGGGTAGCATAISAAKNGLRVLLIEKNTFLGGSMTGALVMPMMKNILKNGLDLSGDFAKELMAELRETNDSLIFDDGNYGWFNSEMLKCTLDDLCEKYNVKILFDSIVTNVSMNNNKINSVEVSYCGQKIEKKGKYFVDATGNGDLAMLCGAGFQNGNNNENQAMTLRFIMSNVNIKEFSKYLREIDDNEEISPICNINGEIHLSTACTWDNDIWKLKPLFEKAVENGELAEEDCAYFQIFTIPNQPTSMAFNAPRIYADKSLDPLEVNDTSYALIQGRKQIKRLLKFVKKYLPGFQNAYISQIAPMLGIRDSRRINCEYRLTEDDILSCKKFENTVAKSNYPIDVHSREKNKSVLNKLSDNEFFEIPLESLKVKDIENLFVAGKIIDSTFLAQAAIRIIPNCLTMGENLGKFISKRTG